jgi:hypothetical protein
MGQQARAKRQRRELLNGQRSRWASLADVVDGPGIQEKLRTLHDEECAALCARDREAQEARLAARGWRRRYPNLDGIGMWDSRGRRLRLLHSISREPDGQPWAHVSVSNPANTMPTWNEVRDAGWLLYPVRHGIIVVAPEGGHVNIANVAHVWYCLTAPSCPDFTHGMGTI